MLPLVCLPTGIHYSDYGRAVWKVRGEPSEGSPTPPLTEEQEKELCPICAVRLDDPAEDDMDLLGLNEDHHRRQVERLRCNHFFHTNCLGMWVINGNRTCPVCRATIYGKDLTTLGIARPGLIEEPEPPRRSDEGRNEALQGLHRPRQLDEGDEDEDDEMVYESDDESDSPDSPVYNPVSPSSPPATATAPTFFPDRRPSRWRPA